MSTLEQQLVNLQLVNLGATHLTQHTHTHTSTVSPLQTATDRCCSTNTALLVCTLPGCHHIVHTDIQRLSRPTRQSPVRTPQRLSRAKKASQAMCFPRSRRVAFLLYMYSRLGLHACPTGKKSPLLPPRQQHPQGTGPQVALGNTSHVLHES